MTECDPPDLYPTGMPTQLRHTLKSHALLELSAWARRARESGHGRCAVHEHSRSGMLLVPIDLLYEAFSKLGAIPVYTGHSHDIRVDEWGEANLPADDVLLFWPDLGYVEIDHSPGEESISVTWSTIDPEMPARVLDAIGPMIGKKGRKNEVYVLGKGMEGYELVSIGQQGSELVRENYAAEVIDDYDHIVADLCLPDPCGRVTIADGPPGTGKTHLVQGLISACEATFIIVPAHMLAGLTGPEMVKLLIEERRSSSGPLILVMEDADEALAPRKFDNITSVSELLNVGDGILGKALDVRILATTNAARAEIDEAILRPGRLCRRIHVGPLDPQQALSIARRLLDDPGLEHCFPVKGSTLADVYSFARGNRRPVPKTDKKVGF